MLIIVCYGKLLQFSARGRICYYCFYFESFINFETIAATPACISFPTGNILDGGRTNPDPPFGGNSMVYEY